MCIVLEDLYYTSNVFFGVTALDDVWKKVRHHCGCRQADRFAHTSDAISQITGNRGRFEEEDETRVVVVVTCFLNHQPRNEC